MPRHFNGLNTTVSDNNWLCSELHLSVIDVNYV